MSKNQKKQIKNKNNEYSLLQQLQSKRSKAIVNPLADIMIKIK